MTELIKDKDKIERIIADNIRDKELIYTRNYRIRNAMRDISDERVLEVFPQFNKVFAIEKKILRYGDVGYELFYGLSNNITFSIATCSKGNRLELIHAIEYKRNIGKRFKVV